MTSDSKSISTATDADRARLFEVWEASVRATHRFLTEADLQGLVPHVRDALSQVAPVHCLRDADGAVCAFMFVEHAKIESLFVAPSHRGAGAGRTLVEYAIRELGAREVDVNEQNPLAVGFYEHLGFRTFGRSPLDPLGNPFPILHMRLPASE